MNNLLYTNQDEVPKAEIFSPGGTTSYLFTNHDLCTPIVFVFLCIIFAENPWCRTLYVV